MTAAYCLALIIYHESRGAPELAQRMVASVAVEWSNHENKGICETMRKPKRYSFMWDGKSNTTPHEPEAWARAQEIAHDALFESTYGGRLYFNECRLGRRFKTPYEAIRSGGLCFY